MLLEARITSKGQITLPKAIRDKLSLKAGGKVRFVIRDDAVFIEVPKHKSVLDWYGAVKTANRHDPKKVRERVRRTIAEETVREMAAV